MENSKKYLRGIILSLKQKLGVEVFDATDYTSQDHYDRFRVIEKERQDYTAVLKSKIIKNPESRYDIEYMTSEELYKLTKVTGSFEGTHYQYYSPILCKEIMSKVFSEIRSHDFSAIRVLDVGCGNGTLLEKLYEFGLHRSNLQGIDISSKAVERVRESNFAGYYGRLQDKSFYGKELIFLSYFIDRDDDQKSTLKTAVNSLISGGVLVLEGLFPCVLSDSNGVSYGIPNVTKGQDGVEDILCVVEFCKTLGVTLQKLMVGQRLVYSLDGSEILPTYILVFN